MTTTVCWYSFSGERVYKPLPKNTDGMSFKINLTEGEQYLWMVHCSCVGLPLYNMYVNGVDVTSLIVDQIQLSKLVSYTYTWYITCELNRFLIKYNDTK